MSRARATGDRAAEPVPGLLNRGIAAFQGGRLAEAKQIMRQVIARASETPDALHVLGLIAVREGRHAEAERLLRRCIAAAPDYGVARNNLGNLLMLRGRLDAAEACYAEAAERAPSDPLPRYNLANCLRDRGRLDAAESAYREALALAPADPGIRVNLANLLRERGALDEAESLYQAVLARHPERHEVRLNLGNLYRARQDLARARAQYEALPASHPQSGRARLSLALIAVTEHRLDEAARLIEESRDCAQTPPAERLAAIATWRLALGDRVGALEAVHEALSAGGETPGHFFALAELLASLGQHRRAIEVLERAGARFGERPPGRLDVLVASQRAICDWRDWEGRTRALRERIRAGEYGAVEPFRAMGLPGLVPTELQAIARCYGARFAAVEAATPAVASTPARLRIGYLSADFRQHPLAYLTASVFERHDRERFEIHAYSVGPEDDSPIRRRLLDAFDRFIDLRDLSHAAAARRIREDEIDILVDLNGYTRDARPEILALRPAPIQVSWLGFPGTMGVSFMDYLIVDPWVVPPAEAAAYDEALAYLPDTYQPVDSRREVARTPTRAEAGLPEQGFIFCCFNNPNKITPELFDLWCGLLRELPDAILWLYARDRDARSNLMEAATARGVEAGRLCFAEHRPQAEHLARVGLADLFLDTLPYNAHTTASDALWVGVPVLTCPGPTFASRVASSLLHAAGLPDLIARDLADYRVRALALARDPAALGALRSRLRAARETAPLFDSERFTRALERLYHDMQARRHSGQPPGRLEAR